MKSKIIFLFIITLCILLSSCSSLQKPSEPLRIAVLPVLDTLPLYVAQSQEYFTNAGIEVELIPVSSAPERDQLLASGKVDGAINELVSVLFFNRDETQIQAVRFARAATTESPVFRILSSSQSEIQSVDELAGTPIGISEGTVIEYLTDRLLQAEGLTEQQIETVSVPGIPDRMALLESGELAAAMLPDPLATLAIQNGASVVIDDSSHPFYGYSVLSIRYDTLENRSEDVAALLEAYENAIEDINAKPDSWTEILSGNNLVPPPILENYQVPHFPLANVPTEEQWMDVVDWANSKGLFEGSSDYNRSVTDQFLP